MSLELNTRIGDPTKLGRDCEIHQHKQVKYSFTICYIRMIVFVDIIQISMFYNDISYSHWFPDVVVGSSAFHLFNTANEVSVIVLLISKMGNRHGNGFEMEELFPPMNLC